MILLFSATLWRFFSPICVRASVVPGRTVSGVGAGKGMEDGLCSGFVFLSPSPCEESWPEQPDLPQVAMDMEISSEISSKIEHKMVFIAFSYPEKKKREGFLSISFHSFWLLAEMVFSVLA